MKDIGAAMDEKFKEFELWYLNRLECWITQGIVVDSAGLSEYGHQYWIKVHSEHGLGNIVLYESNEYYWIDFEAGNYDYGVVFCRSGIDFHDKETISLYEQEFVKYIIWDETECFERNL